LIYNVNITTLYDNIYVYSNDNFIDVKNNNNINNSLLYLLIEHNYFDTIDNTISKIKNQLGDNLIMIYKGIIFSKILLPQYKLIDKYNKSLISMGSLILYNGEDINYVGNNLISFPLINLLKKYTFKLLGIINNMDPKVEDYILYIYLKPYDLYHPNEKYIELIKQLCNFQIYIPEEGIIIPYYQSKKGQKYISSSNDTILMSDIDNLWYDNYLKQSLNLNNLS